MSSVEVSAAPATSRKGAGHHAPSAFGDDLRRFVNLTVMLATTDFKLRYFGSALGYLWSLVRPLLFFGVLYVMFTQILHAGRGVPHYAVYLLSSIMLWTFFAETTGNAVQCLVAREGLLRKIRFPRLAIPLAVSLTALFTLATNFAAVLIFALASGITPRVSWLALPLLVALLAAFAIGTGMLLSALYVRFRDIQPMWEVIAQVLFYGSPIIYVAAQYKSLVHVAMCNPIATILTEMRHVFVDPSAHSAATYIGGAPRLLIPLGIIALVFALGLWFFNREAPRIAERL
ncbi:MAG TPA: ABC transporter permease [Solirubrobacteraceae bacterium]|nr:ABC transporter permease [Solirubrobacteraceae bacterium]